MAVESAAMRQEEDDRSRLDDGHEHDMIMPGFRFHPTEEELVEFYLRRKVEGKRFNVELITFLDLYRYDPWELPALATIGEKEWFFYVPRDRKYRNGDRPNRVTTSGYWKATGADRMIRTENLRSIGLKKTLVFYSGKAPKGIRTSWIMNEYRLPQHETERLQKAEISLCRVYKRAGVEDHPSIPRSVLSRAVPYSRGTKSAKIQTETRIQQSTFTGKSHQSDRTTSQTGGISNPNYTSLAPLQEDDRPLGSSLVLPNTVDDFHRLVGCQQGSMNLHQQYGNHHYVSGLQPQPQPSDANTLLWDWNLIMEARKDYNTSFK